MEFGRLRLGSENGSQIRSRPSWKAVIQEAMRVKYMGLAMDPLIRRVVHEELEIIIPQVIDQMRQQMHGELQHMISQIIIQTDRIVRQQVDRVISRSGQFPRSLEPPIKEAEPAFDLQLVFTKELLLPIYTRDEIKDEDSNHLRVALMRIEHGQSCAFSLEVPIQVEIVVIDGDFPERNSKDWNADEFNSHIKKERTEGIRLLVGGCLVTLHEGIASFGALRLTDNSSWVRSRKFRLGVRPSPGSYQGPRIKEAITERIIVLDQRGKSNQKLYPPSLHDKVWRLDNIARKGVFDRRLGDAGIKTVQDFLKLSVVNQPHLREMPERKWDETIKHARTCSIGEDGYRYSGRSFCLILNPVCKVRQVWIDGLLCALEQLTPQQKADVQKLVIEAYENWEKVERVGMPFGAQERNNGMRDGELEPHSWNHNGLFGGGGASANVLEQVPPQQTANAQNLVPWEACQIGNQLDGTVEVQQNCPATGGGLESWSNNNHRSPSLDLEAMMNSSNWDWQDNI